MNIMKAVNTKLAQMAKSMDQGDRALQWLRPIRSSLKKMGVGRYFRKVESLRTFLNDKMAFRAFSDSHEAELSKVYEMLEDDLSRTTFKKILEFRREPKEGMLRDIERYPQYFQKDIFGPVEDEVFVDGGAFVGDTVGSFVKDFARGGVQKNLCLGT